MKLVPRNVNVILELSPRSLKIHTGRSNKQLVEYKGDDELH
jgi:hypothetical protein